MLKLNASIRLLTVLLLTIALLSSCALRPSAPPDYRCQSFEASLIWNTSGLTLSAVVTVRGATDTEDAQIMSLQFTDPPSLKGIYLSKDAGEWTATCHGVTADAALLSELWQTASLLTVSGTIVPVTLTDQEGEGLLYAELNTEESEETYEFYLHPDSGVPHKIRHQDRLLEIRSFTQIP